MMMDTENPQDSDLEETNPEKTLFMATDPIKTIFDRYARNYAPFGFEQSARCSEYHPLPYKPQADDQLLLQQPWRIMLELHAAGQRMVLGIDLYGDVILGRGDPQPGRIIIDLEPYEAHSQGVSREHVLLRPTASSLYAIDQGSSNGTAVNGAALGRGTATPLKDGDLLSLGNMVIVIHVVKQPGKAKS
jgi:hypothetical protein